MVSDIRHSSADGEARRMNKEFTEIKHSALIALTKVSVMADLELGEGKGNGGVDGNLHGNVTVLQ